MKNLLALCLSLGLAGLTPFTYAVNPLPRSTPEEQGISSDALRQFVDKLDREIEGMHSVMVVRHGQVVAEGWWTPYAAERQHVLYSLSKSFTSTAVGLAVAEGKLSIDDQVLKFFPEDAPAEPGANLKAMRVRDLLMMSTGHQDEPPTAADVVSARTFLAQPVPHLPGTHFKYNTAATFMLSAIVQKVTGETVLDYLKPRLFEPLGIDHPVWDTNFQGISLGGYGLRVRTEEIAKFGLLYLHQGNWNGKKILPAAWVAQATARQTSNGSDPDSDWNQGYGFQFWRCRHNIFRGDGAFGQFCVVMPDQDTVVAITSGVTNMQAVLNEIWDQLLPALQKEPLPPNETALQELRERLGKLTIRHAEGAASSALAGKIFQRTYRFPANAQKFEQLSLSTPDQGKTLHCTMQIDGKSFMVPCGYQEWKEGRAPYTTGKLAQFPNEPVAGTFAWPQEDTCQIRLCYFETPFISTLTLKFAGDELTLESEANVSFGERKQPTLTGKAQ